MPRPQSQGIIDGEMEDQSTSNLSLTIWYRETVEQAESVLTTRVWNGRKSRYPLKVNIARNRESSNYLNSASYQINYVPLNETPRVRYLLTSFHNNDPNIFSAKANIQADAATKNEFESASDFLLITAPSQKHQGPSNYRISILSSKRVKVNIRPKNGVELSYHKRH